MTLITLDEAKEYLRVDTDADDALIGSVPLIYGETVERQIEEEKGFFARLFGE